MSWDFDGVEAKNHALSEALYEYAARDAAATFEFFGAFPVRQRSWWECITHQLASWWWDYRPRVHFGPCLQIDPWDD